jgi:hypothetical protein
MSRVRRHLGNLGGRERANCRPVPVGLPGAGAPRGVSSDRGDGRPVNDGQVLAREDLEVGRLSAELSDQCAERSAARAQCPTLTTLA